MDATEICALTPEAVTELLTARHQAGKHLNWHGRRNAQRLAFPGTVELWLPDENGGERYALATSINLSTTGIGLKADEPIESGTVVGVAIHEPEMSFFGRAVVRHSTETEHGFSIVGLEFVFDSYATPHR